MLSRRAVQDLAEQDATADLIRSSPRELVVQAVIDGLYEGRFEPGQRLTEAELTTTYGVSRGPVREALNRLATMGVVSLTPQRGAHVRILSVDEAIGILVVMQSLVGLAGRLAASRIGLPRAADMLNCTLEAFQRFSPLDTGPAYARARDDFYICLAEISGSAELQRTIPNIQIHLIRTQFRVAVRKVDLKRSADYGRIADAILAGDPTAAEAAVNLHFNRGIKGLRSAVSGRGS